MFVIKHYIILICILLITSCSDQNSGLIPREILFDDPDKTSVSISSDGKYLSYLAPLNGVLNIFIAPIDDISQARAVTDQKTQKVNGYYWSKNSQHIIYKQNTDGDENYYLYSYDLTKNSTRLLTPKSGIKAIIYKIGKDDIIIGLNQRDKRYFDVYKVNLQNFNQELILTNNRFSSFVIDDNLNIRFGVLIDQDGNKKYYQKSDKGWDLFLNIPAEDISNTKFINFEYDSSNAYFLDSRGSNTSVLKKLNLNTKEAIVLAKNELADINIFTSHPITKHVQAISINYDKKSYQVLDPAIAQDLAYLSANKYGWPTILKKKFR